MITELALEPGFGSTIGQGLGAIALYAILGTLLMVFGFYAIDWTTPGKLSYLVRTGAPNAVVVTAAGLVSMALIVVVVIYNSGGRLADGLLTGLIFGLAGIVVQVLAVRLLEWVTRLDIGSLIESDKFAPASVVVAAAHLALGLVVAVAIF
ncbi:DUF350 domain-containing protein [Saccharothrix violaceirubra]|uniref:Uncharacterized membrane protein YjfL (UPF0719 family) n=1 Tax=Saccharothrix violaceirubra TaxID=413306 RepID=A0A7W7WZR7_9PSEU|nr:DUF350 domain-containing protein [Saccharothrix violaceirubra]MBB4969151.1 uncharacterized membrane protein YjfL (UPF0719 family) [Saccharothrix violaceirubra]